MNAILVVLCATDLVIMIAHHVQKEFLVMGSVVALGAKYFIIILAYLVAPLNTIKIREPIRA